MYAIHRLHRFFYSEILIIRGKNYMSTLKPTEMKFFRRTAIYTLLDPKRNEEILEDLGVQSVDNKIQKYKSNCVIHVSRM